jgi:hypothetical protein
MWNGNMWVAVGNGTTTKIAYSYDGINWSAVSGSNSLFDLSGGGIDLAWNGTTWVATGAYSSGKLIAYSTDGVTWSNSAVTGTSI